MSIMAWSSYAHLPTTEDEYWNILTRLNNGMSVREVDKIIANVKDKEHVQHHYRSNLARIGFIHINNEIIILNYDVQKLIDKVESLRDIIRIILKENKAYEISEVERAINDTQSYDLSIIVSYLAERYPLIDKNSLVRWLRPIVFLVKTAAFKQNNGTTNNPYIKYIQEAYLKNNNEYGQTVSLESIDHELKKIDLSLNVIQVLERVLNDGGVRFKMELLMMPSWATKNKSYKVGEDMYTHLKIKTDLKEED